MKQVTTPKILNEKFKIRISRTSSSKSNWKHYDYEMLPDLVFEYDEQKLSITEDDLFKFSSEFWDMKHKDGGTNQQRYERELKEAVEGAIYKLHDEWNKVFEKSAKKVIK